MINKKKLIDDAVADMAKTLNPILQKALKKAFKTGKATTFYIPRKPFETLLKKVK